MLRLSEPQESVLSIRYQPNGETLYENPPWFTWMPETEEDGIVRYFAEVSADPDFSCKQRFDDIPYNFFTPDRTWEPGTYYWRYGIEGSEETSKIRSFTIAEEAAKTPLPGRKERFASAEFSHPRLWLNRDQVAAFKEKLQADAAYCGFDTFYRDSAMVCLEKGFPEEPPRYPNDKKVIALWRSNYTRCQEALVYIRSLAVAGTMTEDKEMLLKAKEALLALTKWDVTGSTSRDYNDECSFRVAYALAFGYDWLYEMLSEEEKQQIRTVLFDRTKQVADHIIVDSRIHLSLYDSHAVRSLSSVLTPCCIVMLKEPEVAEQAEAWLNYTIEYFSTIYTPWGGCDGGWAEGAKYWESAMAFLTEALNTIKHFTGINLYERPFFQKCADFPLYCNPVDTRQASFCDQSNLGKYPGYKSAFNVRQFGGVTGKPEYQWYYEQIFKREPEIDNDFFNAGWWDFDFDEMVYRHDYSNVMFDQAPDFQRVKWFRDVGWAAINENMDDFENHIFFLTKSSPYGSVSHSHGDQNSIILHAYGEPLIIKSGYYIGFNSSMHRSWRRQTRSHNTLLIDGAGQYAGTDKCLQLAASGEICEVREEKDHVYIREQAARAYHQEVPGLENYTREIYFIDHKYFVLVDTVEADHPVSLDFNLHSLVPYEIDGSRFSTRIGNAGLDGKFVSVSSGMDSVTQTDEFEGVNEEEIRGLDRQWHLTMKTKKAQKHRIVTLLTPTKKDERSQIFVMKDDQGQGIHYYFQHEGHTFTLALKKELR